MFRRGVLLALLVTVGALVSSPSALAVHDLCLMELEGDALDNTQTHCLTDDDWQNGTNGNLLNVFRADAAGLFDDQFTQGSKDVDDVSAWRWTQGPVTDKGDLEHAFLAAYELPDGDLKLYFGGDRFAVTGDAGMGIWLLQDDVELNPDGTFSCSTPLDGCHTVGDVLIESEFTNGGGVATINVYEWVGSGGDTGPAGQLHLIHAGADCGTLPYNGLRDDPVCATVNDETNLNTVPLVGQDGQPWVYDAKETSASPDLVYPAGAFYEGGANLSDLFPSNLGCFTDVIIKTSQSQEVTDALNDFVLFNDIGLGCTATTVTAPSSGTITLGDSITDSAVVTGNERGGDPTGTVSFFACGPLPAGQLCETGGTALGVKTLASDGNAATFTSTATSDPFAPTQPGRYCFRGEYSGGGGYPGSSDFSETECFTVVKAPSTTVTTPGSGGSITLGGSITDGAVVSGNAAGGDPTGTVSFFVCGPMATGTCETGGTALGVKNLVSDGNPATFTSTATSDPFTPTQPGRYCFRGEYSGDSNYNPSSDSSVTECFTVAKAPSETVTTPGSGGTIMLGQSITDGAVVSGNAAGGDPTGTVSFFVCGPMATGTCETGGTALGVKTLVSDGNPNTSTSTATSDPFTPTQPGRYCFRGEYSGDSNYNPSSDSSVRECFTVTAVDLAITKTDAPDPVFVGQNITYTLTVTNNGPNDATGVTVTDPLPLAQVTFVSVSASKGSCTGTEPMVCTIGDLAVGETVTISIVVRANVAGTVTNPARVVGNEPETSLTNNEDSTTTRVIAVDLAITKTDAPDPVLVGENITYTITVTNNGPDAATGVTVTDPLPLDRVTFVSVSASKGSCTGVAPMVCTIGNLAVGETVTISIVVTANVAGTVTNPARVGGNEPDTTPGNNEAETTTLVVPPLVQPTCASLTLDRRGMTARRSVVVRATLRNSERAPMARALVTARGAGVRTQARTNAAGVARLTIRPTRKGTVTVRLAGTATRCVARITVRAPRQPVLTGRGQ